MSNTASATPINWSNAPTIEQAKKMTSQQLVDIIEQLDGQSSSEPSQEAVDWAQQNIPWVSQNKVIDILKESLIDARMDYIEKLQNLADRALKKEQKKSSPSQSVENIYSNLMDRTRCLRALGQFEFVPHKDVQLPYQTEIDQQQFNLFSKDARSRPTLEYWFRKWDAALHSIESKLPPIDLDEVRQRLIANINKPYVAPSKQEIRKEQFEWLTQCGYHLGDDDIRKQFADRHNQHVENMTKVLTYLNNRTELFPTPSVPALPEKRTPKIK